MRRRVLEFIGVLTLIVAVVVLLELAHPSSVRSR